MSHRGLSVHKPCSINYIYLFSSVRAAVSVRVELNRKFAIRFFDVGFRSVRLNTKAFVEFSFTYRHVVMWTSRAAKE